MLAHVRVRARMHVCSMRLSARCESGYVCADVHVHVTLPLVTYLGPGLPGPGIGPTLC
jgi:hypothetical protein